MDPGKSSHRPTCGARTKSKNFNSFCPWHEYDIQNSHSTKYQTNKQNSIFFYLKKWEQFLIWENIYTQSIVLLVANRHCKRASQTGFNNNKNKISLKFFFHSVWNSSTSGFGRNVVLPHVLQDLIWNLCQHFLCQSHLGQLHIGAVATTNKVSEWHKLEKGRENGCVSEIQQVNKLPMIFRLNLEGSIY